MSRATFTASITGTPRSTPERIALNVTKWHGVGIKDLRGPSRIPHIVAARHDWWSRLYESGLSYSEIARRCNRDHTSIMHGVRKHGISQQAKGTA